MNRREFFKQTTLALAALTMAKPAGLAASQSRAGRGLSRGICEIDWRIEELTEAKPIYSAGDGLGWAMPEALPTGSAALNPGYRLTKTMVVARERVSGVRLRKWSEAVAPATIGKDEGLPGEIIERLEALDPVWVAEVDQVETKGTEVRVTRCWRTIPTSRVALPATDSFVTLGSGCVAVAVKQ
jgi:hypothetical protein